MAGGSTPPGGVGRAVCPGGRHATFDTSVAHMARVYDYWLGGKENYAADRAAGDAVIEVHPSIVRGVRANRAFLARAVRYLAGEPGIRQFLDLGTGIPSSDNTHEVAQALAPESRVVYVDNDPVVLAHARALLTSAPGGITDYLDADLRDTGTIVAEAARTLDFSRPVAVMTLMTLHAIGDADDPYRIVTDVMAATAPGSYLALSHPASDVAADEMAGASARLNNLMYQQVTFRDRAAITRFFDGLELVDPGVVLLPDWRPRSELEARGQRPSAAWAGVGRKP